MKGLLHSLFGKMNLPRYQYDAFISHAVEDKLPIANELCSRLEAAGLRIWYSGRELSVGDRVSDSIEEGLRKSRFGIVILSPTYIQKNWTMREFYSLLSRGEYGKVVLPVLFDITPEELLAKDITMADTFALRADKGMDYLVESLSAAILRDKRKPSVEHESRTRRMMWTVLATLLVAVAGMGAFFSLSTESADSDEAFTLTVAEQLVSERVREIGDKVALSMQEGGYSPVTAVTQVEKDAGEYMELKTHYRNEYRLDNGFIKVQSKKNVEALLGIDFDTLFLTNKYKLSGAEVSRIETVDEGRTLRYLHRNIEPVNFRVDGISELSDGTWMMNVSFANNIRLVETTLYFPDLKAKEPRKRHQLRIMAMLPAETYLVRKHGRSWALEYYPTP